MYVISLTDFSEHKGTSEVLFRYELREVRTGEQMTDRLAFIFLEMPNCGDEFREDWSALEKFCFLMRKAPTMARRPDELGGELFDLLLDSSELSNFTPDERTKYDHDMTTERDRIDQPQTRLHRILILACLAWSRP